MIHQGGNFHKKKEFRKTKKTTMPASLDPVDNFSLKTPMLLSLILLGN